MIKLLMDAKNRNFLRLWLAQLISQFGDRIQQMALIGLIAERAFGSAISLAKLMSFTILPAFLIQPIAGVLVDRWDRRTTLFVCDIIRGVLVLTIPFIFIYSQSMIPIYVMVFLIFCFSRFYVPAKMSIIPELVAEEHLLLANSLVTTTGLIALALGFGVGGFIIELYGARNGFIIDAGTFFISALFLFSMNFPRKIKQLSPESIKEGITFIERAEQTVWSEIKEGLRYLIQHKEIRFVINTLFVLLSAVGAVYVVMIVFIQKTFKSVTADLGILGVSLSAGLFLGVIAYGKWGKKLAWNKVIYSCLTASGLMLFVFAYMVYHSTNLVLAIVLAFLMGLSVGPIIIASNTIIHLVSDEHMRGKVFSALEVVIHFAFLIAMITSSWASLYIKEIWILCVVGLIIALVGLIGLIQIKWGKVLALPSY